MVIDSPDVMESGMEMAGGSPLAEVNISVGPDVLPTAVSAIPPSDRTATICDCTATVRRSENVQGRRQT